MHYRGYVYDPEFKLYYLESRYYNPGLGRFLNADAFVATGQGLLGNNMYAYCNNSPIIFGDPYGQDAIVLYDENSFSHIGIMAQDENGDWWHFYWGTKGGLWGTVLRVLAFFGCSVKEYTWCVQYSGDITLDDINAADQYSGGYDDWHYFEGDFSQCVRNMKNPGEEYHLYSRNCSQISLRILAQADTAYKEMLLEASNYIVPAGAFYYLKRAIGKGEMVNYDNIGPGR